MTIIQRIKKLVSGSPQNDPRVETETINTINICIGHKPFGGTKFGYVDVMLSPVDMPRDGDYKLFVINDDQFGEHGHTLSEFAQLLWLNDNFDAVVQDYEFIRLFQYRKFLTSDKIGRPSNWPQAKRLTPEELSTCAKSFSRYSDRELVSKPLGLISEPGGATKQYGHCHKIEDFLLFSLFLVREGILSEASVSEFITQPDLIPSATLGVFRRTTLRNVLQTLAFAARFRETPEFIARDSVQRRNSGFLLERLHSHLIYLYMCETSLNIAEGQIIILNNSEQLEVSQ